jgi:hypothetical protein
MGPSWLSSSPAPSEAECVGHSSEVRASFSLERNRLARATISHTRAQSLNSGELPPQSFRKWLKDIWLTVEGETTTCVLPCVSSTHSPPTQRPNTGQCWVSPCQMASSSPVTWSVASCYRVLVPIARATHHATEAHISLRCLPSHSRHRLLQYNGRDIPGSQFSDPPALLRWLQAALRNTSYDRKLQHAKIQNKGDSVGKSPRLIFTFNIFPSLSAHIVFHAKRIATSSSPNFSKVLLTWKVHTCFLWFKYSCSPLKLMLKFNLH